MNGVVIDVNDKERITIDVINRVEIRVINLQLGQYVDVSVTLKNDDRFLTNQSLHIEGEEYANWGNSDDYLENLILEKLGLTRRSVNVITETQ